MTNDSQSSSDVDRCSRRSSVSSDATERTGEAPLDDDPRVVVGLERFLDAILRRRGARRRGRSSESD